MTWFFAIVVVALIGGVAVVASGRGGSMAEAFDDRPDADVPAEGPLTPADLRRVTFGTVFRGYRMSEVDALLDRLAAELEPQDARRPDPAADPAPRDARGADAGPAEEPAPRDARRADAGPGEEPAPRDARRADAGPVAQPGTRPEQEA